MRELRADIAAWTVIAETMRDNPEAFSCYAAAGCARQFLEIVSALTPGGDVVMVPREPTPEMLQAYIHALDAFQPHTLKHKRRLTWQAKAKMRWRAMVGAVHSAEKAKSPPQTPAP